MHLAAWVVFLAVQAIVLFLFAMGIATFATLVKGCFLLRRMARAGRQDYGPAILKSPLVPAVSTIAVPPDDSAESRKFTRRLLDLHFGRNEVVIVLDGPTEAEMETWSREFRLCASTRGIGQKLGTAPVRGVYESRDPVRVVVIDKERGGTVDAWNAGVNAATSPVIGLLDPASEFVPEVLLRLIQPMLESTEETMAVSGGVSTPPVPGAAGQLGALESLRGWLTLGAAFAGRNLTMPFPGCALLVQRSAILQAGGFTGGALELFLRLHGLALAAGKPYRIAFLPEPLSYSRPAGSFADLRLQTEREQREIAHAFHNRIAVAGPFGWQLLRGLYYERFVRPCLELTAYVLAVLGLVLGWVDIFTALLVLLATVGIGIVLSMAAVVLREVAAPNASAEKRTAALFRTAIRENLIHHQLRNLWLIRSFLRADASGKEDRGSKAPGPTPADSAASQ
jgi:hypothetical protein